MGARPAWSPLHQRSSLAPCPPCTQGRTRLWADCSQKQSWPFKYLYLPKAAGSWDHAGCRLYQRKMLMGSGKNITTQGCCLVRILLNVWKCPGKLHLHSESGLRASPLVHSSRPATHPPPPRPRASISDLPPHCSCLVTDLGLSLWHEFLEGRDACPFVFQFPSAQR